jgi:histidinol-phosphatase
MSESKEELLEFALSLARRAAEVIKPHYRQVSVALKPDGTEVTVADKTAEAAMREMIAERYPHHGVLGEEYGDTPGRSPRRWILDPLDGTAWFTIGAPLFGTLIALADEDEPFLGVISFPVLGETVYAVRGMGCWFQVAGESATRVQALPPAPLAEAVASASGAHATEIDPHQGRPAWKLPALIRGVRKFKFCADCFQHALVARGRLHLALDTVMAPWDIAALVPCVEEAGGVVSSLTGERAKVIHGGSLLTSCHPSVHEAALAVLRA